MKVWYLTSEFPPDFGGGISMYVDQVANMLADEGHEVTVFVRAIGGYSIEYPRKNLRIVRFQHMQGSVYQTLGYWAALSYQYCEEVLDIIDKDNSSPDIIEVQEYNAIGYYLLQKKYLQDMRLNQTKIVVHLHTPTFELARINQSAKYEFPDYWIGQMEKYCINAADALVTQSEFLKSQIKPYVKDNKITVIPLPYNHKITQIEQHEKEYDLLYLGRSEYRKGVVNLLENMDALWKKGADYKLKMLGGDTFFAPRNVMLGEWLQKKYSHWIEEGKLVFEKTVPPSELPKEIAKSKAVVIPSLYENYPYNCIIAMHNQVPVIVSLSGGQAEMVGENGVNGFIFDWNQENDFIEKCTELMNLSTEQRETIAQNGYIRIQQLCNLKSNFEKRSEFYSRVLKLSDKKEYPISLTIGEKQPIVRSVESEKGLLSIIIPYYNLGDYVEETLDSALATDYSQFEVVIINDGSTDQKSIEILEKLEKKDSRVRIVTIENGGLANARNVGAEHARGEYIAFLDADDLIDKTFYSKAIQILERYNNVSFVYSWVEFFGARTGIWPTFNTEFPYFMGMNMLTAFVVVRREDFINFGANKKVMEYGLEDYEGWLNMCAHGYSGISIPEVLVKYRVRPESMSRQFNRSMIIYLINQLSEHHPELYSKFGLEIYNLLLANGPGYLWNNPTFEHPPVEYSLNQPPAESIVNDNITKYELMRIANSPLGNKLIKLAFKMKINKIFK